MSTRAQRIKAAIRKDHPPRNYKLRFIEATELQDRSLIVVYETRGTYPGIAGIQAERRLLVVSPQGRLLVSTILKMWAEYA